MSPQRRDTPEPFREGAVAGSPDDGIRRLVSSVRSNGHTRGYAQAVQVHASLDRVAPEVDNSRGEPAGSGSASSSDNRR
jgi:hypothetical protein